MRAYNGQEQSLLNSRGKLAHSWAIVRSHQSGTSYLPPSSLSIIRDLQRRDLTTYSTTRFITERKVTIVFVVGLHSSI